MKNNIFQNKPEQMGLRGDHLFWDDLAKQEDIIKTADDCIDLIKKLHEEKTGEKLTKNSIAYAKEYETKGMSSGYISGEWWVNVGIPLLIKRLKDLE